MTPSGRPPPNRADVADGEQLGCYLHRQLAMVEAADMRSGETMDLGADPAQRAGMIAAPLPLLWRRAESSRALSRIGAKVIVTASHVGGFDHCELAMQVAAELFTIRHVCAFGGGLPDGVIPLDGLLLEPAEPAAAFERTSDPALHVALVTWDVTPDGSVAVARSHAELIAGGVEVLREGSIEPEAVILAAAPQARLRASPSP